MKTSYDIEQTDIIRFRHGTNLTDTEKEAIKKRIREVKRDMKISETFGGGNFLKAETVKTLKTKTVTIDSINNTDFRDGSSKPTISFKEIKHTLVLNRTNAEILAEALGDETENWSGKKIRLSVTKVPFQGKMVDSIRTEAV